METTIRFRDPNKAGFRRVGDSAQQSSETTSDAVINELDGTRRYIKYESYESVADEENVSESDTTSSSSKVPRVPPQSSNSHLVGTPSIKRLVLVLAIVFIVGGAFKLISGPRVVIGILEDVEIVRGYDYTVLESHIHTGYDLPIGAAVIGQELETFVEEHRELVTVCNNVPTVDQYEEYVETIEVFDDVSGTKKTEDVYRTVNVPSMREECHEEEHIVPISNTRLLYTYEVVEPVPGRIQEKGNCRDPPRWPKLPNDVVGTEKAFESVTVMLRTDDGKLRRSKVPTTEAMRYCRGIGKEFDLEINLFGTKLLHENVESN